MLCVTIILLSLSRN